MPLGQDGDHRFAGPKVSQAKPAVPVGLDDGWIRAEPVASGADTCSENRMTVTIDDPAGHRDSAMKHHGSLRAYCFFQLFATKLQGLEVRVADADLDELRFKETRKRARTNPATFRIGKRVIDANSFPAAGLLQPVYQAGRHLRPEDTGRPYSSLTTPPIEMAGTILSVNVGGNSSS